MAVLFRITASSAPNLLHSHLANSHRYTVTPGFKFGGDFLAYPGDPDLVHAQYVVCVLSPGTQVNVLHTARHARVAHAARKHFLLAAAAPMEVEAESTGVPCGNSAHVKLGQPVYSIFAPDGGSFRQLKLPSVAHVVQTAAI